jgi:GxxExxY protein
MQPNEITSQIIDAAYKVHTKTGPGLLKSVYEVALDFELKKRGLRSRRQVPIPVEYEGIKFDEGFRADLLVEESVLVEIKAVEKNHPGSRPAASHPFGFGQAPFGTGLELWLGTDQRWHHSDRERSAGVRVRTGIVYEESRAESQRAQRKSEECLSDHQRTKKSTKKTGLSDQGVIKKPGEFSKLVQM